MSEDVVAQLLAALVGVVVTIAWRLVDRYLPDPDGKHPLPAPPTVAHTLPVDPPVTGVCQYCGTPWSRDRYANLVRTCCQQGHAEDLGRMSGGDDDSD